jgi:hypothetical protein
MPSWLAPRKIDLAAALAALLAVRLAFLALMPAGAVSVDMRHWEEVAALLRSGANPYRETAHLNWPPLWMTILFFLDAAGRFLGLPLFRMVQAFLIAAECGSLAVLHSILSRFFPGPGTLRLLLAGVSLNPILVLLTCQHCNFDALVSLWILLFSLELMEYRRGEAAADWLLACMFLGLGMLTKTVPGMLLPLLLAGFLKSAASTRLLGAALALGPAALGLGVIYALSPADVAAKVLAYRSYWGWFGFTGLLGLPYVLLAPWLLAGLGALAGLLAWRAGGLDPGRQALASALLLAAVPALGPGYGTQYAFWFIPLLVCCYRAFEDRLWRRSLLVFYGVGAATYLYEYGVSAAQGAFLHGLMPGSGLEALGESLSSRSRQTLLRLPLFACYLLVLCAGVRLLVPRRVIAPARN